MTYTPSMLQQQREDAKHRASRRSTAIALFSTLIVGAVLAVIVINAQGFSAVRESFFNWHYAQKSFPRIFDGILLNLRVLFIAEFFVLIFGLAIAIARTTTSPVLYPLRLVATIYTDIFRGMPLLLVLFLVGLGIPGLRIAFIPNSAVFLGTIALVLTYSAYVAEVIRAGIEGVNPTQRQAARALGLSHPQTLRQYDRLGLVSPNRTEGRNRRYSLRDIASLRMVQRLVGEGINHAGVKRIIELETAMANMAIEVAQLRIEVDALISENPPKSLKSKKKPEVIVYDENK